MGRLGSGPRARNKVQVALCIEGGAPGFLRSYSRQVRHPKAVRSRWDTALEFVFGCSPPSTCIGYDAYMDDISFHKVAKIIAENVVIPNGSRCSTSGLHQVRRSNSDDLGRVPADRSVREEQRSRAARPERIPSVMKDLRISAFYEERFRLQRNNTGPIADLADAATAIGTYRVVPLALWSGPHRPMRGSDEERDCLIRQPASKRSVCSALKILHRATFAIRRSSLVGQAALESSKSVRNS